MARIQESKAGIQPFVWNPSLIKEDPLKALQQEEKREKKEPKALVPEHATSKLQAKLKDALSKKEPGGLASDSKAQKKSTRRGRN